MLTLLINGNSVALRGDNKTVAIAEARVEPMMKFQPQGYEYSEKYKSGEWDGFINLYHRFTHSFPRGFLNEVEMILEISGDEYQVVDQSTYGAFHPLFSELALTKELRPYQAEAVERAIKDRRGIVCLPTGTGKTVVAAEIIRRLKLPTVIYVHKQELMRQWVEALSELFQIIPTDIGTVGEGTANILPLTVAMIQTTSRLPPRLFSDFGMTIFDECHHVAAESVFEIAEKSKGHYLFGLSATPYRADGKDLMLKGALGDFVINLGLSDMIHRRYLAAPTVYIRPTDAKAYPRRAKYADVYRDFIVDNGRRNIDICHVVGELRDNGKSVYIHVKQIRHGEQLHTLIPGSGWINGKDKAQKRIDALKKFQSEGGVLISTLLGEGVDVPGMDALVLACGGQSEVFVRQLIGRVLRITAEKQRVYIVDWNDAAKYLYDHAQDRLRIYRSEPEFKVIITEA